MELKYTDANETTAVTGEFSGKLIHIDVDTTMTAVSGLYFKTVRVDIEPLEDHVALVLGYGDGILATLVLDSKGIHFNAE